MPDYFEESNGLTSSNSSAVLEWNITDQITFSDQLSEESDILIQLFDQKNHFDESFESQSKPDWNVTVKFSEFYEYNYSEVEDINLTFTTQAAHSTSFQIDASEHGTYKLEFFVSDQSGNVLEYDLYIILKPGVLTEITAVDGYLSNATVIFDADGDGLSDLNRNFYTNTYGRAQIILSKDELQTFDLNGNGRLDANEGKFIVIGGIDTSTGTKFSGKLIADVNSTVVSPLTTLVSKMMDRVVIRKVN